MKSAKKLLSLLLCAVMLLSVAPLTLSHASAAGSPGILLTADPVSSDGTVTLHVFLENCVGFTDANFTVDYDPGVLTFESYAIAADANELSSSNFFSETGNLFQPGEWRFGCFFKDPLLSLEEYEAAEKYVNFDPEHFGLFDFTFEVNKAADTTVSICCTSNEGHLLYGANASIGLMLQGPTPVFPELELNQQYEVTPEGNEVMFSFVAPFTGDFVFYSYDETGNYHDTVGYFYNSDMEQIDGDDESGKNGHFRLCCSLTEGETYYFGAMNYDYRDYAPFFVTLEHDHDYTVDVVTPASCSQQGLDHYVCNTCGYEKDEIVEMTQHTDLNPRDGICDRCHTEIGIETSGSIGDIFWELLGDGTLRFTGKGELWSWDFSNRTDITRVEIGEGITSVSSWTFRNNVSLTDVILPSTVTKIGSNAFEGCVSLEKYEAAQGNPSFSTEDGVLYNKNKTTLVSYPPAREGESFTVPASVTALGYGAFENTPALTSITFPAGLTSVGECVFVNSGWYLAQPDGPVYVGKVFLHYKGKSTETAVTVKEGTVSLAPNAFSTFYGWVDESSSSWNSNFYDYASITTVNLPDSLAEIGSAAFANFETLKTVNFGSKLKTVGPEAFADCRALEKASLPNSVTSLGYGAFRSCIKLSAVNVPTGISELPVSAFSNCRALTSVTVPGNVKTVGDFAFSGCDKLKTVTLQSGVQSIGSYAFGECSALETFNVPDSVVSVGSRIVDGTKWYDTQPDGLVYFGKILYCVKQSGSAPAVKGDVKVKDGTKVIADGVFYGNTDITTLSLPEGLIEIGKYALSGHGFEPSKITKVSLPLSLKRIREGAFNRMESLKEIDYAGSADDWKKIAIEEHNDVLKTVKINYGVAAHTHVAGKAMRENDVAPTCTAKGSYESVTYCTVCKQEMSRTKISVNALGHKWGPGQQTIAPTAEHEGELTSICTVCGATKKDPIPKLISTAQFRETENTVYAVPKQTPAQLLTLAGSGAKLTDQKGDPVPANGKIGSGMVLTRANGKQEVIVVKGDTTGDGEIKADDARYVLRAAVKLETPNTWQKDASTISSTNGKISASDARMILRAAVSLEKPENWLKK